MKQKLLLGAFIFGSFLSVKAQSSCATALPLPIGTTTVSTISGTYAGSCFTSAGTAANWYFYTATENGGLRINTNLEVNDGELNSGDTRVSVYTGACDNLTCYTFSDDVSLENGEYLTDFQVQLVAGQTYYIAFDDRWDELGFQVEVSFEAFSCYPITGGYAFVGTPTAEEVTIEWTPAINNPTGYEVIWGETGFDPETAGTLIAGLLTPQVTISGLTSNADYDFYVRTVCGEDETSSLVGPVSFTTPFGPATIPYSQDFEGDVGGWSILNDADGSPWSIEEGDEFVAAYAGDYYAAAGAYPNPSDSWLFSRGLSLNEGTTYTLSYYLMRSALEGAGNVNNFDVTIGTEATVEAQTTSLQSFDNYSENGYVLQSHSFTVPASGVYYIGFNYTAPAHAEDNYGLLALDNFLVDVSAGLNQGLISKLAATPNPTSGIVNISSSENILINNINVTDINGRMIMTSKYDNISNAAIDFSGLASGIYMMTISSDNGIAVKKIIKN